MTGNWAETLTRLATATERIADALELQNTMAMAALEAAVDDPCPRCNGLRYLGHPTNPCPVCAAGDT